METPLSTSGTTLVNTTYLILLAFFISLFQRSVQSMVRFSRSGIVSRIRLWRVGPLRKYLTWNLQCGWKPLKILVRQTSLYYYNLEFTVTSIQLRHIYCTLRWCLPTGKFHSNTVIEALTDLLSDPEANVRTVAAISLAKTGANSPSIIQVCIVTHPVLYRYVS